MITRDHFALNYSGYDAALPPPLGFTVPAANRTRSSVGRVYRAGVPQFAPLPPRLMMDPKDPTTWQRAYRFT